MFKEINPNVPVILYSTKPMYLNRYVVTLHMYCSRVGGCARRSSNEPLAHCDTTVAFCLDNSDLYGRNTPHTRKQSTFAAFLDALVEHTVTWLHVLLGCNFRS